jgi:hypothetical protein
MEKNNFFIKYAGTVEFVTDTKSGTNKAGKPYYIKTFAVNLNDTNPEYPVTLVFDAVGNDNNMKKINMLDGVSAGEEVVVTFTINSKPYTDKKGENKYFLSLNLVGVERGGMNQSPPDVDLNQDDLDLPF